MYSRRGEKLLSRQSAGVFASHPSIHQDRSIYSLRVPFPDARFSARSPMASHLQKAPSFDIVEALDQRILILDGAMGTMVQQFKLQEDDYRGNFIRESSHLSKKQQRRPLPHAARDHRDRFTANILKQAPISSRRIPLTRRRFPRQISDWKNMSLR